MKRALVYFLFVSAVLTGCGGGGGNNQGAIVLNPCNGSPQLCGRTLLDVTLLGTHNSYSNATEGWQVPNQRFGLTRQLEDGVRAINLDVYDVDGVATLCHSMCHLGSETLASGFGKIVAFLRSHPREVLTIDFENYVPGAMIQESANQAGLLPYLLELSEGKPWPTLEAMIDSGKRVVLFTDANGESFPGFHSWSNFGDNNGWGYDSLQALDCNHHGGGVSNPTPSKLYSLNHQFVNAFGIPVPANSAQANSHDELLKHVRRCVAEKNHRINVLQLDYYDIGDGLATVQELNGVTPPSPRLAPGP